MAADCLPEHRKNPEFSKYYMQRQWRRAIMVAKGIEVPGEKVEPKKEAPKEEPKKSSFPLT